MIEGFRWAGRRADAAGIQLLPLAWCLVALLIYLPLMAPPGWSQADVPEDDLIYNRVIRELANDKKIKTTRLEVEVEDGVVTVTGMVETEEQQLRVSKVVKKVKGVEKVVNRVTVRT